MKQKIQKIINGIKSHRKRSLIIGGISLILITLGAAGYIWSSSKPPTMDSSPIKITKKPAVKYYSPLTGKEVADENATKQLVTAIMIENSPEARPQSGLKQAGVVYEAIAEGGITRFAAIYQESKPQLIGPVRSLRPYYLEWIIPYDAAIAHIGGSARALAEVRNGSHRDIDQFFNDGAYWRASDRYAPHNVYTSFEKLDQLNQSKGYTTSNFTSWPRIDGKPVETPDAENLTIAVSTGQFATSYQYNKSTNSYDRSVGGAPHNDREEGQLSPSVVVALSVSMSNVMEDGWRESIQTTGSGRAVIFQNGHALEATWKKDSPTAPLQLLNADQTPVKLIRGQTWIATVPNSGTISWQP